MTKINYKFRKKPIIIEAFQMTKERRWDNSEWPQWLNKAWNEPEMSKGSLWYGDGESYPKDNLFIETLEGTYTVSWNDWIIQGVKGELYPIKDEIFRQTYEEVK